MEAELFRDLNFEWFRKTTPKETMKKTLSYFVAALAVCAPQLSEAQATKDCQRSKQACPRQGAELPKNQEGDKSDRLASKRRLSTTNTRQRLARFINR